MQNLKDFLVFHKLDCTFSHHKLKSKTRPLTICLNEILFSKASLRNQFANSRSSIENSQMKAKILFLKFSAIVFLAILLLPKGSSASLFNFGLFDQPCPYEDFKPLNQCRIEGEVQTQKELSLQARTLTCHETQKSKLCSETPKRYPFLKTQMRECHVEGLCKTHLLGSKKEAIEGCQKGLQEAAHHIGKELPKSLHDAEEMILHLGKTLAQFLIKAPGVTWNQIKLCLYDSEHCTFADLKKFIASLPEKTQNEILDLMSSLDRFECLDNIGRFELLCYRSALISANLAGGFAAVGVGKVVVREAFLPLIKEGIPKKPLPEIKTAETVKQPPPPPIPANAVERLEQRYGKKVNLFVDYRGDENYPMVFLRDYDTNAFMGTLDVHYISANKSLEMGNLFTYENYRNMGVSEALVESMLKEFPKVEVISTDSLTQTNLKVVEDHIKKGKSVTDSIKESPAYKVRAKFGFTEIIPESINNNTYGFKVRRPTQP